MVLAGCSAPAPFLGSSATTRVPGTVSNTLAPGPDSTGTTGAAAASAGLAGTAGASSGTAGASSATGASATDAAGGASPTCDSGTVEVSVDPDGSSTVCVVVGAQLVMHGGAGGVAGSWPGPVTLSPPGVLAIASTVSTTDGLTATFRALTTGRTVVRVPFVATTPRCRPTPCTPIPGFPLVLTVTVVSAPG